MSWVKRLFSLIGRINPRDPQRMKSGGELQTSSFGHQLQMLKGFYDSQNEPSQSFERTVVADQLPWDDASSASQNGHYDFSAPFRDADDTAEADLIEALSKSKPFQRLKDVRFDYFLVTQPNGRIKRYTRYQHSLGVAALAKAYLKLRHHTSEQRLLCVAAAMLHDVGHPPFSHTLEPVFEEAFGFNHHVATERLITGLVPQGRELSNVLRSFGIDPLGVIHLLNGGDDLFEGFFSGPINLDTIEGILRARNYLGMQRLGLSPLAVMRAAASRDNLESRRIVDAFWQSKHEVYAVVIRSKFGVFYDGLFQAIAKEHINTLSVSDFYATEKEIFRKIPLLREALKSKRVREIAQKVLPNEIAYQFRDFYIDDDSTFSSDQDRKRYKQKKTGTSLTVREILGV
jgi:uncharacterized protein